MRNRLGTAVLFAAALLVWAATARAQFAGEIVGATGVKAGLCVHVGAADGRIHSRS